MAKRAPSAQPRDQCPIGTTVAPCRSHAATFDALLKSDNDNHPTTGSKVFPQFHVTNWIVSEGAAIHYLLSLEIYEFADFRSSPLLSPCLSG